MIAVKIVFSILALLIYFIAMSVMIIIERDKPKNIIIWSVIFLLTQIVGYIVYMILKIIVYKKRKSLFVKQKEDEIYLNLASANLKKLAPANVDELFEFNKMAYGAEITKNSEYELISDFEKFKQSLQKEVKSAEEYILVELATFNPDVMEEFSKLLIEKSIAGVKIRFVYDYGVPKKYLKQLKTNGIKTHKFSKYAPINRAYSNMRNIIMIDGKTAFIGNLDINKKFLSKNVEVENVFLKLTGEVVQTINLALHQDVVFACKKYIDYKHDKLDQLRNETTMQYVTNDVCNDIELLVIKAISMAKKSIQLELKEFIPTESILSLLNFAINSNIQVRLMVPLKSTKHSKYYASRAYAKELALFGADVYLFDGSIQSNAITIDDDYVITGCYIMDRQQIGSSLQNILLIKDEKAVKYFNKQFDKAINNSYRINDAKFMLLREKFFKNFV